MIIQDRYSGNDNENEDPIIPKEIEELDKDIDSSFDLTYYINDINRENTEVLMDYSKSGDEIKEHSYVYGINRLWDSREEDHFILDGRGSVNQVIDKGFTIKNQFRFDPFGGITKGEPKKTIFGFNGEEYDPISKTQYLRARNYSPEIGRFITTYLPEQKTRYTA